MDAAADVDTTWKSDKLMCLLWTHARHDNDLLTPDTAPTHSKSAGMPGRVMSMFIGILNRCGNNDIMIYCLHAAPPHASIRLDRLRYQIRMLLQLSVHITEKRTGGHQYHA